MTPLSQRVGTTSGGSDAKAAELVRRAAEAGQHDLSPTSWTPSMRYGVGYYTTTPGGIQVWVPLYGWDGRG